MKPVCLQMTAFGPYAGTEIIDFAKLGANTLFLVSGETGSGKTAMLDAMCFALFGEASGRDRESRSMRSDHAAPDCSTEVVLEFLLHDQRYKVTRSPEQKRPKQRGEGFTRSPGSATFMEFKDEQWSVIETGTRQVNEAIEARLRFGPAQFRQLVVLPQGDFRSLLTAKSSEREAILAKLFNTSRYQAIQDALDRQSRALKRSLEDGDRDRDTLLQQAKVDTVEALVLELAQLTEDLQSREDKGKSLRQLAGKKRDALEEGRRIERILTEASAATAVIKQLHGQRPAVEQDRSTLQAATQAAAIEDVEQHVVLRTQEVADLFRKKELTEASVRTALSTESTAKITLTQETQRAPQREKAQEDVRQLTERMATAQGWQQAISTAEMAAQALMKAERASTENTQQIVQRTATADATRIAASAASAASAAAAQLRNTIGSLEQARADIATLAAALEDGRECPVCGSTEHPSPALDAHPTHDPQIDVYKAQLQQAEASAEQLPATQKAAEEAERHLVDVQQLRETIQARLQEAHKTNADAMARQNHALEQLPESLRAPGAIEQAHQTAQTKLDALEHAWSTAQQQAQEAAAAHGKAQARLEEIQQAHLLAIQREKEQREELSKRILEAGFANDQTFQHAKRSSAERTRLQSKLNHWDTAFSAAQDRDQRATAAAKGLTVPDLAALTKTHASAQEEADSHDQQTALLRERVSELNRTTAGLKQIEDEQGARQEKYTLLGRLAEVANGKNAHRITFERFVQAEVLDRVLTAANHRFYPMSEGRYQLQRATQLVDKRRGAGLDLEVFDANTGTARPASTLSGGEGFEACLALALGMAETVQAQSGGIHLDSIFVDEGFGSLGSEDLDRVIQALQSLQEGGRLVGVISHVRELKERIDARLEVHKSRDGSHTKFVVP